VEIGILTPKTTIVHAVGADSYIRPQWKPMPNIAGEYADSPYSHCKSLISTTVAALNISSDLTAIPPTRTMIASI
jgi:hypothetical protein